MAFSDIIPAKKVGIVGTAYIACEESEATHYIIRIGFDGNGGELVLPSLDAAKACMQHFIIPYEQGKI